MKSLIVSLVLFWFKLWAKIALFIKKPTTVGIAGSVGKSSARNAIVAILKNNAKTKIVATNSETGVPLGILGIQIKSFSIFDWACALILCPFRIFSTVGFEYMVVEMGIDEPKPPKNMDYLLSIIKPDIAVSLNISATHTQQFGNVEKIAKEDIKIISKSDCLVGIYNIDDPYISNALVKYNGPILTFGKKMYKDYEASLSGTAFVIEIEEKKYEIKIKDLAIPSVYQEIFASSLLVAKALGIDLSEAAESLSKDFKLPKGRGSLFTGINETTIIDSSYNSSANAVIAYLDLLELLQKQTKKNTVFLMGDMRELGDLSEAEHKKVTKRINEVCDEVYLVGPQTKTFVLPILNKNIKSEWFESSIRAGEYLKSNLKPNSMLLVKGSQNQIFLEEAVKLLLKNSEDSKRLCRQSNYWKKIKNRFFDKPKHL